MNSPWILYGIALTMLTIGLCSGIFLAGDESSNTRLNEEESPASQKPWESNWEDDEDDHDAPKEHENRGHGDHDENGAKDSHGEDEGYDADQDQDGQEIDDNHGTHDGHDGHEAHEEGVILLNPEDIREFGIHLATAGRGEINEELILPGEIRVNENRIGHVSPRFDCIVTSIHKQLGETVEAGEILADMESNETLRPFNLKAPLGGVIVATHITPGESLEAGSMVYTIADTSTVWADLKVYQRDLPRIRAGQNVDISAGHEFPVLSGEIAYLGPIVDEKTRTGLARVVVENRDGIYRPGLFITGNVAIETHIAPIVVPLSAVQNLSGKKVVFIERINGAGFESREIQTGRKDTKNIEVTAGLETGTRYVVEGGFYLKADMQKENFGDGHNH